MMQLEKFNNYLFNKGMSYNTIQAYINDILLYCKNCNIETKGDITEKSIKEYIDNMKNAGVSDSKINRAVSSIRSFLEFLNIDYISIKNPVINRKSEKKTPVILDRNEIVNFLSMPEGNTYKSLRDKLILEMMYYTGIKVSELIELRIKDINFEIGTVIIRSENDRIIPINMQLSDKLKKYIQTFKTEQTNNDLLFTNLRGSKLTRQGIWKIVSYYSDKSDINKIITPNTLRHTFATHLIDNGADLKYVKSLLGFSDKSSASRYIDYLKDKYSVGYLE